MNQHRYSVWDNENDPPDELNRSSSSYYIRDGHNGFNRFSPPHHRHGGFHGSMDRAFRKLAVSHANSDAPFRVSSGDSIKDFVKKWIKRNYIRNKMKQMGIEDSKISDAMNEFEKFILNDENALKRLKQNIDLRKLSPGKFQALSTKLQDELTDFIPKFIPEEQRSAFHALCTISDLRYPTEWFPAARATRRKIIMHIGPTNSGKTYNALLKFQEAKKAIYCGPLRLLAHEIYEKMNETGLKCSLITGEDRRITPHAQHISSTVEMANLNRAVDVAIIDEIQLISDNQRGWAWTQALLGLKANEIHLCGEPTAVPIVKRICESINEPVEVREYKRLSELKVADASIKGNLDSIEKGDCVVVFSRKEVFAMKKNIEEFSKKKCAVIYGALPPETRSEQARRFNDQNSGYDVLVATDAIGMGLNLNISRIIFSTLRKFDGGQMVQLTHSSIRQIGGRAGRYGTTTSTGIVTTLNESDLDHVQVQMKNEPPVIESAGLQPLVDQIELFASHFASEKITFSTLLGKFESLARMDGDLFKLCNLEDSKEISDFIEDLDMTVRDRFTWTLAPVRMNDQLSSAGFRMFAENFVKGKRIDILRFLTTTKKIQFSIDRYAASILMDCLERYYSTTQSASNPSTNGREDKPYDASDLDALPPDNFVLPEQFLSGKTRVFKTPSTNAELGALELTHRVLMLYLWLRNRFRMHGSFCAFPDSLAQYLKQDCEQAIEDGLFSVTWGTNKRFVPAKSNKKSVTPVKESAEEQGNEKTKEFSKL